MIAKLLLLLLTADFSSAFTSFEPTTLYKGKTSVISMITIPRPATEIYEDTSTSHKERRRSAGRQWDSDPITPKQDDTGPPLEWLIVDESEISRDEDEPFHILLLNTTFSQNKRITVEYVASSCSYVLGMPFDDAIGLSQGAMDNGFSCLGTWTHKECMTLGRQLQLRDLVVRVVPYHKAGDKFWQAINAGSGTSKDGVIEQAGGFE